VPAWAILLLLLHKIPLVMLQYWQHATSTMNAFHQPFVMEEEDGALGQERT
jgi:hypothetical protein